MLFFVYVVMQKFYNQIYVCENHAAAAVPLATELVKGISSGDAFLINEIEVAVPFVSHYLLKVSNYVLRKERVYVLPCHK